MNNAPIRLGVAGLGRAFTLMLPAFVADPRVLLAAAADPRAAARAQFSSAFGAPVHDDVEALCADPGVDAIYIATPHQFHAAHAILAAQHGKHVLVEKPMAISVAECAAMIAAADRANVQLVVGHSHSFDAPVRRARALIDAGAIGRVHMINAQYYTDFLYRFRRPEELDTAAIVTTTANPGLSALHDRMPVIVAPEAFGVWLGESEAEGAADLNAAMALIRPAPDDLLEAYPVSAEVNRVANDNPKLLDLFTGNPEAEPVIVRKTVRAKAAKPEQANKTDGQGVLF